MRNSIGRRRCAGRTRWAGDGPAARERRAALDALARAAVGRTWYPHRDVMVLMQGDFTDQPEHLTELAKRFDGGADVVIVESVPSTAAVPAPIRRLRRIAPFFVRSFIEVPGGSDPSGHFV